VAANDAVEASVAVPSTDAPRFFRILEANQAGLKPTLAGGSQESLSF
jgi:hypothetical protein